MRIFDLLSILTLITLGCGVITLIHTLFSRSYQLKKDWVIEYAESFFPVLLIVLLIRSFLIQPYRVPTGSLEPTVMPNDFLIATQYNYGLVLPLWDKKIISVGHPQTGEIALFHWPVNPAVTLVKRVIGVPGDHISYINKVLYINGKKAEQTFIGTAREIIDNDHQRKVNEYEEIIKGVKHHIYVNPETPDQNFKELIVPRGKYFMMGDNRDDSDDSRSWGFVPESYFIGKAQFVWLNFNFSNFKFDWKRIGKQL